MVQYTVTLSDVENKALGVVAYSQQDWIENAVHERCRIAIENIASMEIERALAAGETVFGTKEDIVLAANIQSAAERDAQFPATLNEHASPAIINSGD